jgi:hypothetical protein
MNKYSCKNLTSAIQNLQTLLPRVDLAINSFMPEDGVLAKDEASKIIEQHLYPSLLKKEAYDHLVKVLGSEVFGGTEELKNRIALIETTGKTGRQLAEENVFLSNQSKNMCQSNEFAVVEANHLIPTVRLQVRMLFSGKYFHQFSEIITKVNELGLYYLPHEVAVDLLSKKETQPKSDESLWSFMKPIHNGEFGPCVFGADCNRGLRIDPYMVGGNWGAEREIIFGFRKFSRRPDSSIISNK